MTKCLSDGSINVEVFREVMDQTKEYIRRHYRNRTDFHILKDSEYSNEEAKCILKEKSPQTYDEIYGNIKEMDMTDLPENSGIYDFKKWILKQDTRDGLDRKIKQEITEIKERLEALNEHKLSLLALSLTDRTILDYTTVASGVEIKGEYVNMEKRNMFKEFYKEPRIYNKSLKQAVQTLQSYQLRDDCELDYGIFTEDYFAKNSLLRKTKSDWELLKRGLEFVQQTAEE